MLHPYRLLAISTFGLITIAPLRGQTGKSDWGNLEQVPLGQQVEAVLKDAKSYRGTLESVSDDGITVRTVSGEQQTFPRPNVVRVSVKGRSHRLRNTLVGAAVGASVGTAIGVGACGRQSVLWCSVGQGVSFGAPVVGSLGAGVGVAISSGGWHEVYRAARSSAR